MTTTGAAIEARDLTKTYGKDVRALDGLGFTVEAGSVFGLLGPNGAGKSTTVKILTTLSLPDSGQARVAGIDVLAEPDRVRRAIGLVGQRSGVDLEATGRENLTLQGQVYGLRGAELRTRVGELLERFGLAEAADRVTRGYSGGMQRRLDIVIAQGTEAGGHCGEVSTMVLVPEVIKAIRPKRPSQTTGYSARRATRRRSPGKAETRRGPRR